MTTELFIPIKFIGGGRDPDGNLQERSLAPGKLAAGSPALADLRDDPSLRQGLRQAGGNPAGLRLGSAYPADRIILAIDASSSIWAVMSSREANLASERRKAMMLVDRGYQEW